MATKLEEKKNKRKQRQIEWGIFNASKPSDKDDPVDLEKIRKAEKYMGDYPLKMGGTYTVPENQRINTEKKSHQKILLDESIYNIKSDFNSHVLALRDLKLSIIDWIAKANQRINEINLILGIKEQLFQPVVQVK